MMMKRFLIVAFVLGLILAQRETASAEVRLPGFFNDHMVVQQQAKVKVWGWADPGESVAVTFGGNSATATTDAKGRWAVELPAMKANSESQTLTVKGSNTVQINDVLVGEVWLCSGQSNMEWTVRASTNSAEEIAAANYPLIRHVKMPRAPTNVTKDDIAAAWQVCSPATAGNFTACGYFMARHLHKELNVPIGLINSSWVELESNRGRLLSVFSRLKNCRTPTNP